MGIETGEYQLNTNLPPKQALEQIQDYMTPGKFTPFEDCLSGILSLEKAGKTKGPAVSRYLEEAVALQFGEPLVAGIVVHAATLKKVPDHQPTIDQLQAELEAARILKLDEVEVYQPFLTKIREKHQPESAAPEPTTQPATVDWDSIMRRLRKLDSDQSEGDPTAPEPSPADPEAERIAQLLSNPETRQKAAEIVSQIRAVIHQIPASHHPYLSLEVHKPTYAEDQKLQDLQRQLSDVLDLPVEESFLTDETLVQKGRTINHIVVAFLIDGNNQRGTLAKAIRLLEKMYSSESEQLLQKLRKVIISSSNTNTLEFLHTWHAAAGIDEAKGSVAFSQHRSAVDHFKNLLFDDQPASLDEVVKAFIDRNKATIIYDQINNEERLAQRALEQRLAKLVGVKITYIGEQGDAVLEEIPPAEQIAELAKQTVILYGSEKDYKQKRTTPRAESPRVLYPGSFT